MTLHNMGLPDLYKAPGIVWVVKPCSGVPRNFVWRGGSQQIQMGTEDRKKGDLGVVAP